MDPRRKEYLTKRLDEKRHFAKANGIRLTQLSEGHAVVEMDVDEDKLNPTGIVHGGCLFTMCDVCAGVAAYAYGHTVTTVDANIHFVRAGRNVKRLIAENKEIKRGRTLIVSGVEVKDENGNLLASGTFTFMVLGDLHL